MITDTASRIKASENNLVKHVKYLLGTDAVNEEKRIEYKQDLMAIGWNFNFRRDVWKVMPKAKSFKKLFHCLLVLIKLGSTKVKNKVVEKVAGVVNWYMKVIPAGQSFVKSLYSCIDWSRHRRDVDITGALDDLMWLRAIVVLSILDPSVLCADIGMVRKYKIATRSLWSDASTSVGGGSYLCNAMARAEVELAHSRIRWTPQEQQLFKMLNVSINVLEFFQAAYSVLLWGDELENQVVHIHCDNTAAVSWIHKSRGDVAAVGLLPLLRLLSVYCFIKKITLICTHIAGVDNIYADQLSRDLFDIVKEDTKEDIKTGNWWSDLNRQETCRKLLWVAITMPCELHLKKLLGVLRHLLTTRG